MSEREDTAGSGIVTKDAPGSLTEVSYTSPAALAERHHLAHPIPDEPPSGFEAGWAELRRHTNPGYVSAPRAMIPRRMIGLCS